MGEVIGIGVSSLLVILPPVWLFGYVLARVLYMRYQPEREKRSQVIRSALAGVALYIVTILILITGPSPDEPNFGAGTGNESIKDQG